MKKDKKELPSDSNGSPGGELLQFFVGIVLLGVGLFMLSQKVVVYSGWYGWRIGGFSIPTGTVVIPLLIGIIWYFCRPKSIGAKILIVLGAILIVVSIIMSVNIHLSATSLYDYILILIMIAAGAGLVLRVLFRKRD